MAYTWGSTTLNVAKGTYKPPTAPSGIVEIKILPDTSGNPASVIQQGGRDRKKATFEGYTDKTGYAALETDKYAGTSRTFTDTDGNSWAMIISNLYPEREGNDIYPYKYSIELMEA